MRHPVVIAATTLSVACYFALFWGFEGLRILGSPVYGLDDFWRSRPVYWIARWGGIDGQNLHNLAALFGIVKLAVAGLCITHLVDCIRNGGHVRSNPAALELALLLVVALSMVTVAPAVWQHDPTLIRTCVVNLVLASLAAALGVLEPPTLHIPVVQNGVATVPMHRSALDEPASARVTPAV
ncbi:MAG TPA: hypothetical protein VNQ56_05510 [Pseudolabrys sp.]|nr:hypothetical protein [Pseudolabrys sp.]